MKIRIKKLLCYILICGFLLTTFQFAPINTVAATRQSVQQNTSIFPLPFPTRPELGNVMVVAGGEPAISAYTLGLKADGTVTALGLSNAGAIDTTIENGFENIVEISTKDYHTVGLKDDGTVVAVGNNFYEQCDTSIENGFVDIVSVSVGSFHTIGLKSNGTVVAIGDNMIDVTPENGFTEIVSIASGPDFVVGLKSNGTVVAVGNNRDGQCNTTIQNGFTDIVSITAGRFHTVGLKSDGTVVSVGDNTEEQCDTTAENGFINIVKVTAGDTYTVGLKSDGTAVSVGGLSDGMNTTIENGFSNLIDISTGAEHTVGLKADGSVVSVGYNWSGECNTEKNNDFSDIKAISTFGNTIYALKNSGEIIKVGFDNERYDTSIENGFSDLKDILLARYRLVALKNDGTVLSSGEFWGPNNLNTGLINGFSDITAISIGSMHTVGLKNDGTVIAVGANSYGECDTTPENGFVNISKISAGGPYVAGGYHTVGLKNDGTIAAVGFFDQSILTEESGFTNLIDISAGSEHTVGLKADGTVVAKGIYGLGGQGCATSAENGFTNITKISAGVDYTVALKENRTVVAVGNNTNGQCNTTVENGFTDIVDIYAGEHITVAIKSDGRAVSTSYKLTWDWYEDDDTDENSNRFLSYPFNNPQVKIQEGWRFTAPVGPNSNNPYAHLGIDYINGLVNQPETWSGFDVFAAADGVAIKSSGGGYGDFVLIRHDIKNSNGENYFTLYSQLNNINSNIVEKNRFSTDYNTWTPVNKGDKLGIAGNLPSDNPYDIPLHFEVHAGSYAHNKTDPYDIKNTRNYYPGNTQYQGCGDDILWTDDPLDVITDMRDFKVGDIVHIIGTEGLGLRLRSSFTLSSDVLEVMPEGAEVNIIGGYVINDGYDWWEVQYGEEVGWAAGCYLYDTSEIETPVLPSVVNMYTLGDETIEVLSEVNDSSIYIAGIWDTTFEYSYRLQVEIRNENESYSKPTHSSDSVNGVGQKARIYIKNLKNGNYKWRYRTINSYGLASEWVEFSDEEYAFSLLYKPRPFAYFTMNLEYTIPDDVVIFSGISSTPHDYIAKYEWDFGDGQTAEGKKVAHSFSNEGVYNVKLKITTDQGLFDTNIKEFKVINSDLVKTVNTSVSSTIGLMTEFNLNIRKICMELNSAMGYFGKEIGSSQIKAITKPSIELALDYATYYIPNGVMGGIINNAISYGVDSAVEDYSDCSAPDYSALILNLNESMKMFEKELIIKKDAFLQNIDQFDPDSTDIFVKNIEALKSGNEELYKNFLKNSYMPRHFHQIHMQAMSKGVYLLGKEVGKVSWSLLDVVGPKPIMSVLGLAKKIEDYNNLMNKLNMMELMFSSSFNAIIDAEVVSARMTNNLINGFKYIEENNTKPFLIENRPKAEILDIEHFIDGSHNRLTGKFKVKKAYSILAIKNSSEVDGVPNNYHLSAKYDEFFKIIDSLFNNEAEIPILLNKYDISIDDGVLKNVRVDWIDSGQNKKRKIPFNNDIEFTLLGEGPFNTVYYCNTESKKIGTTYIDEDGTILTDEEKKNIQLVLNPIYADLSPTSNNGEYSKDYTLEIEIINHLDENKIMNLKQNIPANFKILDTDGGVIIDDDIHWNLTLSPNEIKTISVQLRKKNNNNFVFSEAELSIYDTVNDEWDLFLSEQQNDLVHMSDANLEKELCALAGKEIGELTYTDMSGFTNLELSGKKIGSISGLEYAFNLQELNLDNNQINSISFLMDLSSLETISVSNNQITDIYAVSNLTNLESLDISRNSIISINPLLDNIRAGGFSDYSNSGSINISHNRLDIRSTNSHLQELLSIEGDGEEIIYHPQTTLDFHVMPSGTINITDCVNHMSIFDVLQNDYTKPLSGDLNSDGIINIDDLLILKSFYNKEYIAEETEICYELGIMVSSNSSNKLQYPNSYVNRMHAVRMYLRLLGLEETAINYQGTSNYNDVSTLSEQNQRILAFIKANPDLGDPFGDENNNFNPYRYISPIETYEMMLLLCGYVEATDYDIEDIFTYASDLGIMHGQEKQELIINDIAKIIIQTLKAESSNGDSVIKRMIDNGIIDMQKAIDTKLYTPTVIVTIGEFSDIVVVFGNVVYLPESVSVTLSDGTVHEVLVIWDDFDISGPGSYTIQGNLDGYDDTVEIIFVINEVI
jgi:alpha-tubulin suppressor-like RCC1 family protein/Leucine-rich repeat (LRR) protein